MKTCSKCKQLKNLSEFYKLAQSRDGHRPDCRFCVKVRVVKPFVPDGHKRCSKCEEVKVITDFHKHKSSSDGYFSRCKLCRVTRKPETYVRTITKDKASCSRCREMKPFDQFHKLKGRAVEIVANCKSCVAVKGKLEATKITIQIPVEPQYCKGCGQFKDFSKFHKSSRRKTGITTLCKICRNERNVKAGNRGIPDDSELHGEVVGYNRGCRCPLCITAHSIYQKNVRANYSPERKRRYYEASKPSLSASGARRRMRTLTAMTPLDIKKSKAHRRRIKNNPCYYCGIRIDNMHVEHVYPLVRGGTDHWWNLVMSCQPCNNEKYMKTGKEYEQFRKVLYSN